MSQNNKTVADANMIEKVIIGYLNADQVHGEGTKMDKAKAIGKCALYGAGISAVSFGVTFGTISLIKAIRGN